MADDLGSTQASKEDTKNLGMMKSCKEGVNDPGVIYE